MTDNLDPNGTVVEIIKQAIAAATKELSERLDRTSKEFNDRLDRTSKEFNDRLDRAAEAIATEISSTREELLSLLQHVNIRLDRIETRLAASEHQLSGIQKWMVATEKSH